MAHKLAYIPEQVVLAAAPSTPSTGYSKLYRDTDGIWYEVSDAGVVLPLNFNLYAPQVISVPGIATHNSPTANTSTNAFDDDIEYPIDGDYLLTISFNYNVDSNNAYGRVYARIGAAALDLNDRASDPQGDEQILVVEMKDNGNTQGGAISGTGSGIKMPYTMQFYLPGKTAGTTETLQIDIGCQTANVEASIWNIITKCELVRTI